MLSGDGLFRWRWWRLHVTDGMYEVIKAGRRKRRKRSARYIKGSLMLSML